MPTSINEIDAYKAMTRKEVEGMTEVMSPETIAWAILDAGAFHIRDVAGGEEAYHYSSGNFGPGYVLVKGLVGRQKTLKFLVRQLALRLQNERDFNFIAGLVTGGVPPALLLRDSLQQLQGREIGYVYIRDTRKAGGTREHITGIQHITTGGTNPEIPLGSRGVVMEELTNFRNSLLNGAELLRDCGYLCNLGFSLLDYNNPAAIAAQEGRDFELKCLITLPQLLDAASTLGTFPDPLIQDYRDFLRGPAEWMAKYGLVKKEHVR